MMKKKNLLSLSIKDFFSSYFLGLAFLPLIITLVILFTSLTYGINSLNNTLNNVHIEKTTTTNTTKDSSETQSSVNISYDESTSTTSMFEVNPMHLLDSLQSSAILSSMLENKVLRWIIEKVVFLIATYFILIISVIISVTIVGFFTPLVVKKLKSRHYTSFEIKGHGSIAYVIFYALKSLLVMILLYILFIPLYFIPLLNIVAFNLPAFYFFHKMLVFDVGSTINSEKEYKQIKTIVSSQLKLRTFFMYLLTMIPFIGIFLPLFFVIYLSHIFINESVELRAVTG